MSIEHQCSGEHDQVVGAEDHRMCHQDTSI